MVKDCCHIDAAFYLNEAVTYIDYRKVSIRETAH